MGATLAFSGLKEKLEKYMFTRDFLILERGIERDQSMSYPDFIWAYRWDLVDIATPDLESSRSLQNALSDENYNTKRS